MKTIIAAFCMMSLSFAGYTQVSTREKLIPGIKAGVNYSNVYDEEGNAFRADSKLGMVGGVFLSIPISKFIGLQPEILYSQKGFTGRGNILGSPYEVKRTSTFIDVPILFSIKPLQELTIVAGPQYSYLISQKNEFDNGTTTIDQESEFENDNIRKNILCFLGGVDFNIMHGVLGLRAGWDILKNNGNGTSTTPRYKNAWYQATFGIRLY